MEAGQRVTPESISHPGRRKRCPNSSGPPGKINRVTGASGKAGTAANTGRHTNPPLHAAPLPRAPAAPATRPATREASPQRDPLPGRPPHPVPVDAGTAPAAILDPPSSAPMDAESPIPLSPADCNKRRASVRAGHRSAPPRQRAWANWCAPAAVINATQAPALVCLQPKAPALKPAPTTAEQHQPPKPDPPSPPTPAPLAAYITRDTDLLQREGWTALVTQRRQRGDFTNLETLDHPAARLIDFYRKRGVPAKMSTAPWSAQRVKAALERGPHKSCADSTAFLQEEFADMVSKGQWVVLPASAVKHLPGLRVSPMGMKEERDRRDRVIIDYSFSNVNQETLPLVATEAMQFGHALDRILRQILLANPAYGPVQLMKIDISDGFYRVNLNIDDIPKLGVAYPTAPGEEQLIAFPLVLPMGWKNSPPAFCTVTETIADTANQAIRSNVRPSRHRLDDMAQEVKPQPPPPAAAAEVSHDRSALPVPTSRDPYLPQVKRPLAATDVFVDDFIGLAQLSSTSRRVRRILMHAIDNVLRPLDKRDSPFRREVISIKKLLKGDCSWHTSKVVLGWLIDTVSMTISLPAHRVERLAEILASIPEDQKRTSVKKWHKILGELRSMSLALPGARHLFSHMQLALATKIKSRVTLSRGVHDALADFRWLLNDIKNRPTRIAELVPLLASAEGHHDASGAGAGGVWFPSEHIQPRDGYARRPVLWRLKWPQEIIDKLVSDKNPNGTISNSDLELAGGLLHLEAIAQTFDVRERTLLSKTDNLNTLFWQRKASSTTDKVPAYLLRLFGIHQRYHRYVARHDYLPGPSNPVADALSRDFHLTWAELISTLSPHLPPNTVCQLWTPTPQVVAAVFDALLKSRPAPESIMVPPAPPRQSPPTRPAPALGWASMPYSKPARTRLSSYTSSPDEYDVTALHPREIPQALERLKVTYGTIGRRPRQWGPR